MRSKRALGAGGFGTTVAALAALLALLGGVAAALTADDVLSAMPFGADDQQRIKQGEMVSTTLPSSTNRELAVALAFTMSMPPEQAATKFRQAIYRSDPKIIAWAPIDGTPSLDAFKTLTLGRDGAAEAQKYLNAAPGETLNLSPQEIAAFDALDSQQSAAATGQTLVEEQLRKTLLARVQAYQASGLAGIAPYARDGTSLSPGDQLRDATDASKVLAKFAPAAQRALLTYPQDKPANLDERFHWAVYEISGRPTVTLSHRIWSSESGTAMMVDRIYYVSTGFNTEQAIGGFIGISEGTMVFYTNRTSTDQVDGFGSSAKRAIGDHMMESALGASFQKLRGN
jgi:hypothetical protein